MSLREIERAITQLPAEQVAYLSSWLADYEAQLWDQQIERDLGEGRLDTLLDEVDTEYEADQARPLPPRS